MLRFALPAILLGLVSLGAAFCGTPDLTDEDHAILRELHANSSNRLDTRSLAVDPIQVYVHVVTDSKQNDLYTDDVQKNIDVLNERFAGTLFNFMLADTRAIVYEYGKELHDNTDADRYIKKHHIGTADTLNIYLVPRVYKGVGGYSTLPWNYKRYPQSDGIVLVRDESLIGKDKKASLGVSLVHEVGHWLGLGHTSDGGCSEPGDYIDDTPAHIETVGGCPVGRDTCPDMPGLDPIHNYMSFYSDDCKSEFTPGQIRRMEESWEKYRDAERPRTTTTTKHKHPSTRHPLSGLPPGLLPPWLRPHGNHTGSIRTSHRSTKATPSSTKPPSSTKTAPTNTQAPKPSQQG